jgi:hypothetical protein
LEFVKAVADAGTMEITEISSITLPVFVDWDNICASRRSAVRF